MEENGTKRGRGVGLSRLLEAEADQEARAIHAVELEEHSRRAGV